MSFTKAFEIVGSMKTALHNLKDEPGVETGIKFNSLLNKNPDLYKTKLRHIKQCLSDQYFQYLTYANITLLDIESSFSKYSAVFTYITVM